MIGSAFWLMIAVLGTAGIAFVPIIVWLENRKKERDAHYRDEMARRIADASDAAPILEYVRETERAEAKREREGKRLAGLINLAVGAALTIFLYQLVPGMPVYLCGLIPLFVGVAILIYSELMARPD